MNWSLQYIVKKQFLIGFEKHYLIFEKISMIIFKLFY